MVSPSPNARAEAAIDPSDRGAADAAQELRSALRKTDLERVQNVRWLAPRPPGERDLLSDLAAAEGIDFAIKRLARFWDRAEVRLERVRAISDLEAEVYERMSLPGESLPIVTLVRRASVEDPWRVVCTNEAHDERFAIWMASSKPAIDDVAWTRAFAQRFGGGAELIMDGETGVLGDPEQGWLGHVRGPFTPRVWPAQLPGEGGTIVELTTALAPSSDDRREQLGWVLEAATIFLEHLDGPAAYFPAHDKMILPQGLESAVLAIVTPEQSLRFWARTEEIDGWYVTSGLRQLGLPEIEAPIDLTGDPKMTASLVRWFGARVVEHSTVPAPGTELVLEDRTFTVQLGRRGPRKGKSYGRWGALRIAPAEAWDRRGSRTRMRVTDLDY
jgi:hypothetical protein